MAGVTPQQRTRDNLTARGYLVGSVERRKKFPDRKKGPCRLCGKQPMIEISSDLWEVFDVIALRPASPTCRMDGDIVLVQTTSRNNHSTRRNKILASMEAKIVLLSGVRILIQSWRQDRDTRRWQAYDEWIGLSDFGQANYPNSVVELMEIRRKSKKPNVPAGTFLPLSTLPDEEMPF